MIGAWLTEFWEEDRVENGSRSVGHGYLLAVFFGHAALSSRTPRQSLYGGPFTVILDSSFSSLICGRLGWPGIRPTSLPEAREWRVCPN